MPSDQKRQTHSPARTMIWCASALIAACIAAWLRGVFRAESLKQAAGILSDSFLIPGIILAGSGGLGFIASKGTFDVFSYMFSRFSLHSIFPSHTTHERNETLYDYKCRKEKNGRNWSPATLYAGLLALGLSFLFLGLYALL